MKAARETMMKNKSPPDLVAKVVLNAVTSEVSGIWLEIM